MSVHPSKLFSFSVKVLSLVLTPVKVFLSTFSIRTAHKDHTERLLHGIAERPYHRGTRILPEMQVRKRAKLKLRDSCDDCSDAKIKCNKEKPVCSRCNVKGLICCYGPSHRSGRRSTAVSKASERSRKSTTPGPVPASAQVIAPALQPASTSNETDITAALNAASNTDFNFSIDAFAFPDIALDGAASEMTPFTMFPELLKMDVSAPEYDVAALMSSNPDSLNNNSRKSNRENSNSSSNNSLIYNNGDDSISSGIDGMTYDPQWFNDPGLTFPNNFASGLGMQHSSSYASQMTLPDISTPSSLQSSIFNHQPFPVPNSNTIFCTPPPKTSCTCLMQALSLLAALHDNNNASSSTSSTPPVIGALTALYPPYADNDDNNTTSPRNLVSGGGTGVKSAATTIHQSLFLNTTSLQQATTILNCECSTHNQQLVFFVAFIALKTMDRYTAAAHGADTLDRSGDCGDGGSDFLSISKDTPESSSGDGDGGGKGDSRARAQLVLGELHRVVRLVVTLSKRMRGGQGRRGSSSSGLSSQTSGGKSSEISGGGSHGAPGGYEISESCFAQLENDLRKHLKAVTNDTMAILRRE